MMQHLSTFLEVLESPPLFANLQDKEACEIIIGEFTDDQIDELANTSYAYWIVSTYCRETLPKHAQQNSALKEIRRHYIGERRNNSKTITAIRSALEYRHTYHINILRSCFYDHEYKSTEDDKLASKYKSLILEDLQRQPMMVIGDEAQSQTIVYKPPRTSNPSYCDEAFLLTQLYTAERAIATQEFTSIGQQEKLSIIFNFQNYSSSNTPSTTTTITLTKILQRCYPERLNVLVVADPPFWMKAFFTLIRPFMSTDTTNKMKLTEEALQEIISDNTTLQQLVNDGTAVENESPVVDLVEYTQKPFYCFA